jgi:hypothetical protein
MDEELLKQAGGRKVVLLGADPDDPASVAWNFGIVPQPPTLTNVINAKPTFHQRFPKLQGKWDGKTSINHYKAVEKVLGSKAEDLIQYQPRGTCGGRSGSAAADFVQCILIAAGKRTEFKRVSHAGLYYHARKLYGMLNGSWTNDNNDGVASGSIPEAMAKCGLVHRTEVGDSAYYGDGSDDLACKLGAGDMDDLARKIDELAKDNIVTEWTPIGSAAEAADAISAGGIIIGSDSRGFSMSRDNEGCCSPRGTWYHYHVRCGVEVLPSGRKVFPYWQSWGKSTPSGPRLPGYPGNVFGVDWTVQDQVIKRGDYAAVFGFPVFDIEEDKVNVSWSF